MSSSDPTSNLDTLNFSIESMIIPAAVGEAASSRSASSTPRRARSKSLQGQGQGRLIMSQVIKSLPKVHGSGRVWLLLQLVMKVAWNPGHHSCLQVFLPMGPRLRFTTPLNIMISDPSKFMLE